MAFSLNQENVSIPCPSCQRKTKKTIGWIRENTAFTCECGAEVKFDQSDYADAAAAVEASMNKLLSAK